MSRPPRRLQTQTERDIEGLEARRARELAAPHEVPDDITGRYEGEELDRARARRPSDQRLAHAEHRIDDLVNRIVKMSDDQARRAQLLVLKIVAACVAIASAYFIGRHGA